MNCQTLSQAPLQSLTKSNCIRGRNLTVRLPLSPPCPVTWLNFYSLTVNGWRKATCYFPLDSFFSVWQLRTLALVFSPSQLQALTFFPLLPSLQGFNYSFTHCKDWTKDEWDSTTLSSVPSGTHEPRKQGFNYSRTRESYLKVCLSPRISVLLQSST